VHPLPTPKKDRTAAERQRRHRERKRATPAIPVTAPPVTVAVTPVTSTAGVDVAAYPAAITLAGLAAFFSIKGMTVIFPAMSTAVVAMAGAMEAAKLVTAGWLAARWNMTGWIWRLALVTLIAGLAVINATGVYAQLVAAHVGDRGGVTAAIETQDAALTSSPTSTGASVKSTPRSRRRQGGGAALSAIEGERRARATLADERTREASCGAADRVKALTMYLGTIPVGSNQSNSVIFYFFSTATVCYCGEYSSIET
jgi:hypothetical protein